MAGNTAAAPILNDMSSDDAAAFEAMRDDSPPAATEVPDAPADAGTAPAAERDAPPQYAQDELRTEREARARAEERTNLLLQRLNQHLTPQQPAPEPRKPIEIPDAEHDAIGAIKAMAQGFKALQETDARRKQLEEHNTAARALVQHATQAETAFARQTPDYEAASSYLKEMRYAALMAIPGMDQGQAIGIMQNEGIQLAARAVQNGINPAAVIYNIARAHGYAKSRSAPAAAAIDRGAGTGRERSGGTPPAPKITAQKLAGMSDKEFSRAMDSASPSELRDWFGS